MENISKAIIPTDPLWLSERTIFLANHGSHAYGTSMPTSDRDYKGFCVPPREYMFGFSKVFEQREQKKPNPDLVIYGIKKFLSLAADCNPSIIEVLWVDESDVLIETIEGRMVRDNRWAFLSQKAKHTFCGYAISQLKRIRTHRKWLLDPPKAPPTRAEFDLPERRLLSADQQGAAIARIQQHIDTWELDLSDLDQARRIHVEEQLARVLDEKTCDDFRQAGRLIGFDDNLMDYLQREKEYKATSDHWKQYQQWKEERNEARAALEARWGFDTKNASHLVRLLRMCREILEGKGVIVKRPDAKELLEIRNGEWTYEQIVEFAEREDAALYDVMKTSKLPKAPDREKLDKICEAVIERMI